jgi:drug/metabolite transporter (DMT)-like permease
MRFLPMTLLVLANGLWGSSYVVAKVALEEIPPPLLAALRFTLAAAVLWVILLTRGTSLKLPTPRDAVKLLALGAVGVGANGLLGYWGVSLTTATDAALLIVGEVLFTTALAVLLSSERLGQIRAFGLLVGVAGVIVLILGGATAAPTAAAPARALGNVLILAGLAFESAFTVLGTRLTRRYDPLTVLTVSLSGSCVLWLPVIGLSLSSGVRPPSTAASLGVLYLALVTSVGCYLVWFSVLRRAGAAFGALSLLAQPVVGALLGIVLLGDPLTGTTLLGGVCVTLCLVLASLRSDPVPRTVAET